MANISRLVNVTIALRSAGIQQQSFSDMLIAGPHTLDTARVMVIKDANDLLDQGMLATDPIYLAAQAAFSQIPSVPQVYIGRLLASTQTLSVGTPVVGDVFKVTLGKLVNGEPVTSTVSYTAPATPTAASVATALATAITAAGYPVTAAASGTLVTLTGSDTFSVAVSGKLTQGIAATAESIPTAMAAISGENSLWYGIILTSRDADDVLAMAAWAEANGKLFGTASADENSGVINSTTDVIAQIKAGDYFRTAGWYHAAAATEYLDAAIMSKKFTVYPGGETWANAQLGGVQVDPISDTFSANVIAKNGNTFEPFRNVNITQSGKVGGGEWIDVIRFRDWLVEQVRINVFSLMVDNRIPFTDPGILSIKSKIQQALDLGQTRGGIAPPEIDDQNNTIPSYVITVPLSASVSDNDKANRTLNDVKFTARLAGAIHVVTITGTLSYSL